MFRQIREQTKKRRERNRKRCERKQVRPQTFDLAFIAKK
jgi:hypothetical protein